MLAIDHLIPTCILTFRNQSWKWICKSNAQVKQASVSSFPLQPPDHQATLPDPCIHGGVEVPWIRARGYWCLCKLIQHECDNKENYFIPQQWMGRTSCYLQMIQLSLRSNQLKFKTTGYYRSI